MKVFKNIVFLFLLLAAFTACQKEDEKPMGASKTATENELLSNGIDVNGPGTFLAIKGLLKITVEDSTYIFDAAKDSVAFVSVALDSTRYFGITAINKDHTVSFGISSAGVARADTNSTIAGTQLLFSNDDGAVQYTLSKYISTHDMGKIDLVKFKQDSTLSKGTFSTILSRKDKPSSYYKTTGTFYLLFK